MKRIRNILLLLLLVASSLACNVGSRLFNKPEDTVVVSTQAVEDLLSKVQDAESSARSGAEVELVMTESEVTSMVVYELQKQSSQPIKDIQVFLREGQVKINGVYQDSGFAFPLEVVAEPNVDDAGQLQVKLVTAKIGPMSAPDALRDQAQAMIDEAVSTAVNDRSGGNFVVTFVEIIDGNMTIRGYYP